jgi:NADH dehydrogenase (ubiquinone) 1 alpha/beta subcomplex 1
MNRILRGIASKGSFSRFARTSILGTTSTTAITAPFRKFSSTHLSPEQVQSRLLTVLASFSKAQQLANPLSAKFVEDLGLDSLDVVEVVMAVEEEFGVEIPDEVADGFKNLGDVGNYLESLHK